jgi:putative ABC transport system permease protein
VAPAAELVRLLSLVGFGLDVMSSFGVMLMVSAALSTFVALYNSLQQRQYDLAILRSLGASRYRLAMQLLVEALLIGSAGCICGVLSGHVFVLAMQWVVDRGGQLGVTSLAFSGKEFIVVGAALGICILASVIPILKMYRLDVSRLLARS